MARLHMYLPRAGEQLPMKFNGNFEVIVEIEMVLSLTRKGQAVLHS